VFAPYLFTALCVRREHGFVELLQRLSTDATFHLGVPLAKELLKKYAQASAGGPIHTTTSSVTSSPAPPPFLVSASSPNLFASQQAKNSRLL
jgi:hypothetical protein